MLENFTLFFITALTALAVENTVFARGLGLNKWGLFINGPKTGILYGMLLTWLLTVSSVFAAGINYIMQDSPYIMYLRAPLYFICVSGVYIGTYMLAGVKSMRYTRAMKQALPGCAFSSALFGTLYVTSGSRNFFEITGYALGAGIGYTLAILIIYYARKRLAISPVSRSFRGLPILLMYIGLLSLALYGLIGHGLPT